MSTPNPPAFPSRDQYGEVVEYGMTLRDWFAAKAMQGILAGDHPITHWLDAIAETARVSYKQADAMLKERDA